MTELYLAFCAVGYIMISCISEIRTSCAEIRKEVNLR